MTSPGDFLKQCHAYNIKFKREYTMYLGQLKAIRWVGALIYNSNVKKQHRKQPDELFSLPEINDESKGIEYTKEEINELKAILKKENLKKG